jgi:hypothetical protein
MQRDSRYGERTARSIPHEGPNRRNLRVRNNGPPKRRCSDRRTVLDPSGPPD